MPNSFLPDFALIVLAIILHTQGPKPSEDAAALLAQFVAAKAKKVLEDTEKMTGEILRQSII